MQKDDDLEGLVSTVKRFTDDIGIEFGLDKCAKVTFTKGSLIKNKTLL